MTGDKKNRPIETLTGLSKKMGRQPTSNALTGAERQRIYLARSRQEGAVRINPMIDRTTYQALNTYAKSMDQSMSEAVDSILRAQLL